MSTSYLTLEQAEDLAKQYYFENHDRLSYRCTKKAVKLKSGLRDPYPHEEATYVVDLEHRTCSCEAFIYRPHDGHCKHLRLGLFAHSLHLLD